MARLKKLNFNCIPVNHQKDLRQFQDTVWKCDIGFFSSIPSERIIHLTRKLNPDIYTVNFSTTSNADVSIAPWSNTLQASPRISE